MNLRPYQSSAVDGIYAAWQDSPSTLIVLPTGTGKTIVMAHVVKRNPKGRSMLIAHREELIWQAKHKIHAVTGIDCEIEMAEYEADRHAALFGKSPVVLASVQTLISGATGAERFLKFNPYDFGELLIDEAHHATAASYRKVISHFSQNPNCKILGVTATPDRTDEEALGQIFQSVAYDYEILDAIHDGWLVPIEQRSVVVDGLDLSSVKTTAGDLNGHDLARVMDYESVLHGIAHPCIELCAGRKTLVFADSVAHAERLCEIFNRHSAQCAQWVCGETPREERRDIFQRYAKKDFQYLVNVGVATEGFDDPGIEVIAMARPTKSRSLYAQMVGRGTRPLPGLVDGVESAECRLAAIAASAKPACEVIDFVGNSGKHKLVSVADILGGKISDEVIELAIKTARASGGRAVNMATALKDAQQQLFDQKEKEKEQEREAAERAKVTAKANYATRSVDPFDVFHIEPERERAWDKGKPPSEKMIAMLERQGIDTEGMTFAAAKKLIAEIAGRWDKNQCSFKQAKILAKHNLPTDVSREKASEWIDAIAANNWRPTPELSAMAAPVEIF